MSRSRLVFHEKVIEPDGGIIEVKIWAVPVTSHTPHGFKYSLVYVRNGERAVGYDNHERKGDHRHIKGTESDYKFKSIDQLFEDFYKDIRRIRDEG